MKNQIQWSDCSNSSLLLSRETGPFYSSFCQDLCKQQLDAGSPPVYEVQWQRWWIQFSPLQIKLNITSGSFPLTRAVLWHALPLAQCQQNKIFAVSRLRFRMTLFFKPKSYLYKCLSQDILFLLICSTEWSSNSFIINVFFVQGNEIVFPVHYVNTEI